MTDDRRTLRLARTARPSSPPTYLGSLADAAGRPPGRPRGAPRGAWAGRCRTGRRIRSRSSRRWPRPPSRGSSARPGRATSGSSSAAACPPRSAADWLASAWDQNAGLYALSPAAAVAEEVAAAWLVELLGLPAGTSVGFVTGATMANFTALAAARHGVLAQVGWDVERHGLQGAPPVTVVTHDGTARHGLRLAPDARSRARGRARPAGRRGRPGPDAPRRPARGPRRRSTARPSCAPRPAT